MKFCAGCGKTISVLNDNNAELCQACTPPKKAGKSAPGPDSQDNNSDILSTLLSVKDGKIVLESEEGWLLWSGDASQQHSLQHISARASKILQIRKRQKK